MSMSSARMASTAAQTACFRSTADVMDACVGPLVEEKVRYATAPLPIIRSHRNSGTAISDDHQPCTYPPSLQRIIKNARGRLRVNRVDPAMSVTCPLYPQLLPNSCGAAKRRDVPGVDVQVRHHCNIRQRRRRP